MARRRNTEAPRPEGQIPHHEIIQRPMDEVLHLSMIPYAEHVILDRALPRVEDGLKPVQRRILFTLHELGVTPDKPHKKCARIVGDCLGKYHPHGDSSVYDALVRLAQPYSMRGPLVDGHGNFGSIDGDSAAAMRYTEARMAPLALEMLRDLEKDTVPFSFNFDDTLKEPDLLPARYPNLLVNGTSGIAVGLATNIPPHNLKEAIDATLLLMERPEASLDEVMRVIPGPDFPTGGCLLDTEEIRTAYETGRGKLTLRARVHTEDGTSGRKLLVITEVPYQISKAAMLEKILRLSEEKKALFSGIYDIRDESDRTGLRAVIELRRDVDPDAVLAALYKYSDLQITFGVNMVAIAEGKPVQMGIRALLRYYIEHQRRVLTRRTRFELEQAKAREHILAGLIVAVDHLDEVIAIIRKSKSPKIAKEQLMNRFGLTDIQSQAILDLRLQRLTGLEVEALRKEYMEILATIRRLERILRDEKQLMLVLRSELLEIQEKFGDARRTDIVHDALKDVAMPQEQPSEESTYILLYTDGQIKRMQPRLATKLLAQEGGWEDVAVSFETTSGAPLYIFTNRGGCFVVPCEKLQEVQRAKDRGAQLTGIVHGVEEGERAIAVLPALDPNAAEDLLFITKLGQIKRTAVQEYVIRRAHFSAITLKGEDEALCVLRVAREDARDVLIVSSSGNGLRFRLGDVSGTGRVTAGVRAISLPKGTEVLAAALPKPEDTLTIVSDRGYGKRMLISEIERQGRATVGQKLITFGKEGLTGTCLEGAVFASEQTTMLSIQQKRGETTQLQLSELPVERRTAPPRLIVSVLMDDVVTQLSSNERRN